MFHVKKESKCWSIYQSQNLNFNQKLHYILKQLYFLLHPKTIKNQILFYSDYKSKCLLSNLICLLSFFYLMRVLHITCGKIILN